MYSITSGKLILINHFGFDPPPVGGTPASVRSSAAISIEVSAVATTRLPAPDLAGRNDKDEVRLLEAAYSGTEKFSLAIFAGGGLEPDGLDDEDGDKSSEAGHGGLLTGGGFPGSDFDGLDEKLSRAIFVGDGWTFGLDLIVASIGSGKSAGWSSTVPPHLLWGLGSRLIVLDVKDENACATKWHCAKRNRFVRCLNELLPAWIVARRQNKTAVIAGYNSPQ